MGIIPAGWLKRDRDVLLTSPADGDTISYNASAGKWENGPAGGGAAQSALVLSADPNYSLASVDYVANFSDFTVISAVGGDIVVAAHDYTFPSGDVGQAGFTIATTSEGVYHVDASIWLTTEVNNRLTIAKLLRGDWDQTAYTRTIVCPDTNVFGTLSFSETIVMSGADMPLCNLLISSSSGLTLARVQLAVAKLS